MAYNCIICNETAGGPSSVVSVKSLETIKAYCEKWAKVGKKTEVYCRVKDMTFSDDEKYHYHRKCYQSLCHNVLLARAQRKYEEDITIAIQKKRQRPGVEASSSKQRKTFDQNLCVFCQSDEETVVHSVSSCDMGRKFLLIKKSSKCEDICARLAFLCDEKDAFAQNMKYHINCLRKETRAIEKCKASGDSIVEEKNIGKAISDIEIVNIVRSVISENIELDLPGVDMNSIHNTYKILLEENGVTFNPERNYKPHIKDTLLEEIPDIEFASRGSKPKIVFSTSTKEKLMAEYFDAAGLKDKMELLYQASQIIRSEISEMENWNFSGSFSDFSPPLKLQQFMKWVISGPHTDLNVTRELQIEKTSQTLAQHVVSSYRSRRQLTYDAKKDSKFQKVKKTPLTVGLALTSYQANRSRSDVKILNDLQVAVNYEDVEWITTQMASSIIEDAQTNTQGVHMPPFVRRGIRPLFAIDNIDLGSDSGSFHGADLFIAQKEDSEAPLISNDLKLDLNIKDKKLQKSLATKYYECEKLDDTAAPCPTYKLDSLKGISTNFEQCNITWLLMCSWVLEQMPGICKIDAFPENLDSLDELDCHMEDLEWTYDGVSREYSAVVANCAPELQDTSSKDDPSRKTSDLHAEVFEGMSKQTCPTWSTFNSLNTVRKPKWNVGIVAPLYRRSPTELPVLLTILKQAQKINCVIVGEGHRPIITLDGDLYDRAVKLKDYKSNWCNYGST